MIKGLWHFSFTVSDLDRSLEFYCGLLGMQLRLEQRQANPYTGWLVGYPDASLRVAQLTIQEVSVQGIRWVLRRQCPEPTPRPWRIRPYFS